MKNIFIGILIGIVVLVGLYFYHTNTVKKSYEQGLKDCVIGFSLVAGDTLIVHDTVYTVKQKIVPHIVYKEQIPKLVIDTTIYFQEAGKVRVWSDDIAAKGLEIEPIYYLEHNYIHDTVFVNKIQYVEVPPKPLEFYETPTFYMVTGAVIGGVIVYYLREK